MKEDILKTESQNRLGELRALLVNDLIEQQRKVILRVNELENSTELLEATINEPDLLREKLCSILEEQTNEMKHKFDELFGQEVGAIIKNSEPQLIKALTPIMGKLIQKWIAYELGKVQSRVNKQIKDNPVSAFIKKIIPWGPPDSAEERISKVNTATIKDILIIQKGSGIVICSYSKENPMNKNQFGGLITAIKAFGEDALKVGYKEEIEELRYVAYRVLIYNDFDYFAAILLDGHSSIDFTYSLKNTAGYFMAKNINGKDFSKEIPEQELSEKLRKIINENVKC